MPTTNKQSKRERYRAALAGLALNQLEPLLLAESALPGRRANLELAAALADHLAGPLDERTWGLLAGWLATDASRAPTNSKREYLPFCAAQVMGACYADSPSYRPQILERLRAAAGDERWRTREAVCFGLQRIGQGDPDHLLGVLGEWWPAAAEGGALLEQRAILVTLAHPALLEACPDAVELALELCDEALRTLSGQTEEQAKGEGARALAKGLGFVPSVVTAADSELGFARLRRWAEHESPAIKKLVVANLRKARLAKHFPDEIEGVVDALSWGEC